jgi:hypothetical protein
MLNEGNQMHNFTLCLWELLLFRFITVSGTVINYSSGSAKVRNLGSGSAMAKSFGSSGSTTLVTRV